MDIKLHGICRVFLSSLPPPRMSFCFFLFGVFDICFFPILPPRNFFRNLKFKRYHTLNQVKSDILIRRRELSSHLFVTAGPNLIGQDWSLGGLIDLGYKSIIVSTMERTSLQMADDILAASNLSGPAQNGDSWSFMAYQDQPFIFISKSVSSDSIIGTEILSNGPKTSEK